MMWRVRLIPSWIYLIRGQLMGDAKTQTICFYDRHPISSDVILAKLRSSRGDLNSLRPDELFPHDQDHYGGLAGARSSDWKNVAGGRFLRRTWWHCPLSRTQIWSQRHRHRIDSVARRRCAAID